GPALPTEHLMVVTGAQQGMDLSLRSLVGPDDVVLVQEPIYPGVLQIAAQHRQRVVGVPCDGEGIVPAALEAACARYAPRMLCLVPTFGNPTGECLSEGRRSEVLRLAREH